MYIRTFATLLAVFAMTACWSPSDNRSTNGAPTTSSTTTSGSSPAPSKSASTNGETNKMTTPGDTPKTAGGFQGNLPKTFQAPSDSVGQRMFKEYGAMFVARGVTPPNVVVFRDEAEVSSFQSGVQKTSESVGGITIELQTAAMKALKEAVAEASAKGLSIAPNNPDSAKRTYQQTITNWNSRVGPGLTYWLGKGRITAADAAKIRALSPPEQVPEIFKLEDQGIFFALGNQKTIIYSVAPPGTSQHISMLALDVEKHKDAAVREVLAKHGWFQTVTSDLPHFTYLGAKEEELPGLGLKKVTQEGRTFWIPDM